MRRYLLDTAAVAALLHNRPGAVSLMRPWIANDEAATSILVYGEVIEYVRGRSDYARYQRGLRALLRGVRAYAPTYSILERYADLRRAMRPPLVPMKESSCQPSPSRMTWMHSPFMRPTRESGASSFAVCGT